ncbi:hypothetical protein C8R47DRAFT_1223164 [Mycena vitilis]|nr:hypothetical protein C8R47DRAFT_1223164 [Mycena vitilis]
MALVLSSQGGNGAILTDEDVYPGMPTTGPDLELQLRIWTGAETLWPFLADPGDSPICAATVRKLTRAYLWEPLKEKPKAAVRILRTKHQRILKAILHFVAIPRPTILQQALEWKLNDCQCDLTLPVLKLLHPDLEEGETDWTYNDMMTSLLSVLELVLENVKVGHVAGPQSTASTDSEDAKWPLNTTSFFPAGPEEAIVSFAQLYSMTKSPSILDFIRAALPHCPSLAAPTLNSTPLWDTLLEELTWVRDNLDKDPVMGGSSGGSGRKFDDRPPPTVSLQAIVTLTQILIFTFAQGVRQNIQSTSLMRYARSVHDALLDVLLAIKRRPPTPHLTQTALLVTGAAMSIITTLPKNHPQRPSTLHPSLMASAERAKAGPFTSVYAVITRLSEGVAECCNATCSTTSESSGQKLRYCAQCEVMRL